MYVYAHMYAYVACSSSVFRIRKTALFLLLQPSLNVRITSQMQQYYITSLPKLFSECTAMNSGCLPFERVKCLNEKRSSESCQLIIKIYFIFVSMHFCQRRNYRKNIPNRASKFSFF